MTQVLLKVLLLLLLIPFTLTATNTQEVEYSYAGNFKGILSFPEITEKISSPSNQTTTTYPIILFSYDQYVDLLGKKTAAKVGYDLDAFIKKFNSWGYACFVPIERYRKLNALKGALFHIQKNKNIDLNNIFLIGAGEGALLSLLAVHKTPKVKAIIIIDPNNIHKKGYLSYPNLIRQIDSVKAPILFIASKSNQRWKNKRSDLLYKLFIDHNKEVSYNEYFFKKKWFWNPKYKFMDDIKTYLDKMTY